MLTLLNYCWKHLVSKAWRAGLLLTANKMYRSNASSQLSNYVMGLDTVTANTSKKCFYPPLKSWKLCTTAVVSLLLIFPHQKMRGIQVSEETWGFQPLAAWWTCYVWIFKQKQPRITDAKLVTSLTLQDEKKNIWIKYDLMSHSWSAFPRISEMTCGNDGKGIALPTKKSLFEAERQHRFVPVDDGLHWTGWLVYLIVTAASFVFSLLPFWFYKVGLPPLVKLVFSL